jgi:hypothetical protein
MNPNMLLHEIARLQLSSEALGYPAGLFPSQRQHIFLPVKRDDSNIFFSASVLYILESIKRFLGEEEQQVIHKIGEGVRQNYPAYQNLNGLQTYNFWQTRPSRHFPNGRFMHRFRHFKLPDDADTTSLVYLTNFPTPEAVTRLHAKLPQHANLAKKQVQTTLPKYRDLPAYSTWFGENMPIEFDVCVLCNLFLLFSKFDLPLNAHDEAVIKLIVGIVKDKDYFTTPYQISPAYPNASIILYHISRLVANTQIVPLKNLQAEIIKDLQCQFRLATHPLEKVILDTSLIRFGEKSQYEVSPDLYKFALQENFFWFSASMLSVYGNPLIKPFAKFAFTHLKYNCEAFNLTLLLEHEVYRNKVRNASDNAGV